MIQESLFEEAPPAYSPEERRDEVLHPLKRLRKSFADIWSVFYFSGLLAAVGVGVLRAFFGTHDEGEEIVVLATPLMISFLVLRVLRISEAPLPLDEAHRRTQLNAHERIAMSFGIGMLLSLLVLGCASVYWYFGIQWAASAGFWLAKALCVVLIVLAVLAFFSSAQGKHHLTEAVRILMAFPEAVRVKIERIFPRGLSVAPSRPRSIPPTDPGC